MYKYKALAANRDFKRVYAKGSSLVHPLLVTYYIKNNRGAARMGITTTKKIGKACKRNRARRLIKAAIHELEQGLPAGYDIIFVARTRTTTVKMQDVLAALKKHVQQIQKLA